MVCVLFLCVLKTEIVDVISIITFFITFLTVKFGNCISSYIFCTIYSFEFLLDKVHLLLLKRRLDKNSLLKHFCSDGM